MATRPLGPWPLPQDIDQLHNVVIEFSVVFNTRAAKHHAQHGHGPLAYKALQRLNRTGITTHRSVRSLCEAGWTPTTPTLLRTMLDLLVSIFAVGNEPADAEFMGFRFMAHGLVEMMADPDFDSATKASNAKQVDFLKSLLSRADLVRANDTVASYQKKVPPYWYNPEISSPGTAIRQKMPVLLDSWKRFCGSTHGSDIGAVLFADDPDNLSIGPEENPRMTRLAIFTSSRLLLDISHIRAHSEGVADDAEYKRIVDDFIKPQEAKMNK
jgi:hypothetical protein